MLLKKRSIKAFLNDSHFEVLVLTSESRFGEILKSSTIDPYFTSDEFSFYPGFIDGLRPGLKENHKVNQIIYINDTQWRRALDKKIEELQKSINFGTHNQVVLKKIKKIQEKYPCR